MEENMTYIVAECGINANGDLEEAKNQMLEAMLAGVSAVKFQMYNTDKLYNGDTSAKYYNDSKRGEFIKEQFKELYDESPIEWFATPFDIEAVDFLEKLGVKRYKIASRSVPDFALLRAVASTGKPVIMSTGEWVDDMVDKAVDVFDKNDLTLLYCVTQYPADIKSLDFEKMLRIGRRYNRKYGFSDHTFGIWASIRAAELGASVIEKHFTTSRLLPGCDQICSAEPHEMRLLVQSVLQNYMYENRNK
jgi:N,N'-diacetyllegionaminate synthase